MNAITKKELMDFINKSHEEQKINLSKIHPHSNLSYRIKKMELIQSKNTESDRKVWVQLILPSGNNKKVYRITQNQFTLILKNTGDPYEIQKD